MPASAAAMAAPGARSAGCGAPQWVAT
jgi:hypothetical protein